jgi:hypothetical protein
MNGYAEAHNATDDDEASAMNFDDPSRGPLEF